MVKGFFPGLGFEWLKKGLPARRRFEGDNARVVSMRVTDEKTGERRGNLTLRLESYPSKHVCVSFLETSMGFRKKSNPTTSGIGGTVLRRLNQQLEKKRSFCCCKK